MPTSRRRWLLPDALRSAVVVVDIACAGSAVLLWVSHNDTTEILTWLGGVAAGATFLTLLPRRRRPPTARTVAAVIAATQPPADRMFGRC
ncbi:MAG TPA: hypothetical protein VFY84_15385, partial [Jiangellales bacterium]|nr:hypothetical protein [Jiangellales bacterium]